MDAPIQKAKKNPAWTRDELILALDLYLNHRHSPYSKRQLEAQALSKILSRIGLTLGLNKAGNFRNENSILMKLSNFRRWDPDYIRDGKKGLEKGNKDEKLVWQEFAGDPSKLASVAAAIRNAIESPSPEVQELAGQDELGIEEAEEGKVLTRLHRYRERNRALVEAKKKEALKVLSCLQCEACGFDFEREYGPVGNGLIDIHHTRPLHTLKPGETTKLSELALLCANCHRVIHSKREWLSVEQVRALRKRP
ncbi:MULTISPECIES: HNH endonuclease [unclassified Pseudomonas]|uniref:HNH endonuclease n=1 Tax=unclassified Pseudomonas TaxID=196821 RepID=UPI000DA73C2F|nr:MULTISPECIES: HNH endonuclease [unclassified Pseudomonas]MDW3715482.1 HNH endonuclease [Pseudomonas sp. 2023EL-01195]PZE09462.1 HNH endonuclease [Pseudomonas sp. 57B-090624]